MTKIVLPEPNSNETVERLTKQRDDLYDACAEFVRKCDNGEARSKRSYAQMKAAMKDVRR
jgi:hypothetical protein